MARVIAVVGNKGGSGKSTAAHLIAHGCGSLARQVPTVVVTTDPAETPRTDRRRYAVMDGRTRDGLLACMRRLLEVEYLLVVLDGAAARPEVDAVVADVADLALLPFKPSAQDAERAVTNLAQLPASAVALPMDWPALPASAKRVKRYLEMLPAERRLPPFKHIPKLADLLGDAYTDAAYDLANPARGLALEVLARAGIDPDDLVPPKHHGTAVS
ncbi:hypothetical protein [Paracraurococcus lichenis]|uniref:ParA family protein n=1 Tax=Paracraurococcus lichenis TaxID=3064888 RepID=A0ABT9ED79_9PROT|nr:hypothetical protein [Paracraurococcus sp. LOR1-02]MDO9714166.1 hypothetical protein [Paracraurococcus sp. LOR1-02]